MRYNFVKFGITSNLELDENRRDYPFFEQNREKFSQIFNFLSGAKECFIISGLQGVGKSKVLNEAISYLNNDVLLFRYRMYEATTLDDILLNLTIDFREYQKNLQIELPKIDTKDFRERIQSYIKNINRPMLLILEAFENTLKCEETSNIINDFLLHIATIDKFKIIFVSRNFNTQILEEKNIAYDKTIITSLEEKLVEKYFQKYELQFSNNSIEKITSASRCYLKYIDMTIKLLQTFNLSLDDLMNEYELKNINYYSFLIGKFLSLIPEKSKELVYVLTLIRQGITPAFLELINKKNPSEINYLKNILILNEDTKNNLYIKDYFKRELEKEIEQFEAIKIHGFLEKFYNNMLPEKPLDRTLLISRNTMHKEKNYHSKFVENFQLSGMKAEHKISSNLPNIEKKEIIPKQKNEEQTNKKSLESLTKRKKPNLTPINNLFECIKTADKFEKEYDFSSAIFYYQKALEFKNEKLLEEKKPEILNKIGKCYTKVENHEKAVQYFNLAYEQYLKQNLTIEANELLLNIALEHKNNYNFYLAKNYAQEIIKSKTKTEIQLAKTYNLLAEIEDASNNLILAKDLYKKALDYSLKSEDKSMQCDTYFKYGLILDDINQQTQAIEHYKKCIEISSNPKENHYLSSAYSNLAGISYERGSEATALNYYQLALEADKATHNNEGLYFVYTKLSSLYETKDKETSYKFLLNALQTAKRLKDKLYLTLAYIEIGDYYYRQNANPQAIKAYLSAKYFVESNNDIDFENKTKIETRLKDLKIKIGQEKYKEITEGFKYNDKN